ncbi:Glycoside hydrolase [Phytophthora cinnamomi]|uniref:Glycoside hydrolase n=1 Tax=Phytophthora cinnamomi TaxID=4785 RepID=UPI00355A7382|nr:Glycoside hydrolase [Phytophthora cinnamomi]
MHNVGVALALAPALAAVCLADNLDKYGVFTPKKIALGSTPSMDGQTYSGGFTLTSDEPLATLDFDYEAAGLPYFVVSSISNGTVDVEVKYSEQFPALSLNHSDGPSQFTTSIANSRRVGTHRFMESNSVGLQASIEVIDDFTTLPGKFSSSNAKYDEIWKLGARAVTAACLDANSQLPSWSSSEENCTFVPDTRPGISYKTWDLTNYVLNFESQIIRGGAGYTIAYDLTGNRDGIQIHLASEYPSATTYANMNTTLFPANTATLAWGYDFANATSMTSYILGQYDVSFIVKENVWYPVEIRVNSTAGNILFSVDGEQVFDIVLTEMGFTDDQLSFYGWASRGEGAIGFGGWQDQASYVRNSNPYGACLDGATRDRYIWLGNFYHTTRIMGVANSKPEQVTGTWEFLFEYQADYGQLPGFVPISYQSPMPTPEIFLYNAGTSGANYYFPDHVILGLIGLESYMDYYDGVAFVEESLRVP